MTKVSIISCQEYSEQAVLSAVRKSIDIIGGIRKFVSPGQKVLLKPNMLAAASPEDAVCTHPLLVWALITLVKEAQGEVYVGDSPAIGSGKKVAQKNGIAEICQKMSVPLIEFNTPQEISFPDGDICKKFIIDKAVMDADVIINLPKLKTHGLTYYTGGVKNLYGCIPGKIKAEFHLRMTDHEDFSNMLLDLYSLVKPTLTVMDAVIGMEGAGPRNGKSRKIGAILASESAVALDVAATKIVNINPLDIPTIKLATKRNIDIHSIDEVEILGDDISKFIIKDFKTSLSFTSFKSIPRPILAFIQNRLTAKPFISQKCIGCGVCEESCPPKVIEIKNKKAVISYDNCIRCYCCQELCPHDAIELKRGMLGKMLFR